MKLILFDHSEWDILVDLKDLAMSDLEQIQENCLIHSVTKMNYQLLIFQMTDYLHTIFHRQNYNKLLRDMFLALNGLAHSSGSTWNVRMNSTESVLPRIVFQYQPFILQPCLFQKIYRERIVGYNYSF